MLKRIICLFLACLVIPFTACSKGVKITDYNTYDPESGIYKNEIVGKLVESGSTSYKVIVAENCSDAEFYAATEFKEWLYESTGANIAIVREGEESVSSAVVSIGRTEFLSEEIPDLDYAALSNDGFFVRTSGENLFIVGLNDRGTIYGVYDFLEKYLGIRFLTSDETYVPETTECVLYRTDISESGAFEYRNYYSYGVATIDKLPYYTRIRLNAPECDDENVTDTYGGKTDWYDGFNVIHNCFYWVSTDLYDEYPQLFSSRGGITLEENGVKPAQLCLTNGITDDGLMDDTEEVTTLKVALESFKKFINETMDTGEDFFFFGQNDYRSARCQCDRCLKSAEENGGYAGINIRFINCLMREIKKWLKSEGIKRDIRIGTFAYQFTQNAPVRKNGGGSYSPVNDTVIPDDDVYIRMAIYGDEYYAWTDEKQEAEVRNKFETWSAVTENLMAWTYEMNAYEYLWYFPTVNRFAQNIRDFKENGIIYAMLQDNYNGYGSWQADMNTYVGSKLLWNPYRSTEELIDEYLSLYYGMAAPFVKQMIDGFNAHYELLANKDNDWKMGMLLCEELYRSEYYSADLLENMIKIINDGIDAVENSDLSREEKDKLVLKLRKVRLTPSSMLLKNYGSYYVGDRKPFAQYFFAECEACGVQRITETLTMEQYKADYGL